MPAYRYQVRSASGQVVVGVLSADSPTGAAAALRTQGNHVLSISALEGAGGASGFLRSFKELNSGRPTLKHVLDFTTQLAVMVRAGIGIRSALEGIAEQTEHALPERRSGSP